jgi:tetratricopeptide (TPR) repeat protein
MKPQHPPYEPCPCGSGRKYKFCCQDRDREAARDAAADPWLSAPPPDAADLACSGMSKGERLNDRGLKLLQQRDFIAAERCFRASIEAAPLLPRGHNNLANTLFLQGKLADAIRVQEGALRGPAIPNPFGRAQLVHFYLVAGRDAEAEATMAQVLQSPPTDAFAMGRTCQSLALLGQHRQIADLLDRYPAPLDDLLHWYAGAAAANLGRADAALEHLQAVSPRGGVQSRARDLSRRLESGHGPGTLEGNWPYFECVEIIPRDLCERAMEQSESPGHPLYPVLHTRAMVDVVVALLNTTRGEDDAEVAVLADIQHPRAAEVLQKIAEGTFGSDALRLAAMHRLVARGIWSRDETHTVWLGGRWTEAQALAHEMDCQTPSSAHLPPADLMPRYRQAVELGQRGRLKQAEKIWRELLAKAPDHPPFHLNLAVTLKQQGHGEEAEVHLRQAMALEPDYLFAPCTLAVFLCESGKTAEAQQLLDDVVAPEHIHPDALACYLAAQVQVAIAAGEYERAVGWMGMAEAATPDHPNIRALAERLAPLSLLQDMTSKVKENRLARGAKRRQRVLPPDATLETCLEAYARSALAGMAKALQLGVRVSQMRKGELLAAVCAGLRQPDVCRAAVRGLGAQERAALRDVLEAGGRQDYAGVTRRHGTDAEDLDDWAFRQPQSPMGRLKCLGLLVEATVERVESVFIPAELPLDPAWLQQDPS